MSALREDIAVVTAEMGHTSGELTLSVYTQPMRLSAAEVGELRALVEGHTPDRLDAEDAGGSLRRHEWRPRE
jgi:hypothetical protein